MNLQLHAIKIRKPDTIQEIIDQKELDLLKRSYT